MFSSLKIENTSIIFSFFIYNVLKYFYLRVYSVDLAGFTRSRGQAIVTNNIV